MSHNLLLTAEEHSNLLSRRTAAGSSGCSFESTVRATPKRDCRRQVRASTESNRCYYNNIQVTKPLFPQAIELHFCFWLAKMTRIMQK
jgi:hypothetical protein